MRTFIHTFMQSYVHTSSSNIRTCMHAHCVRECVFIRNEFRTSPQGRCNPKADAHLSRTSMGAYGCLAMISAVSAKAYRTGKRRESRKPATLPGEPTELQLKAALAAVTL